MKYKVTLKGKTYEVEVEKGEAMILDEYAAAAPAPAAVPTPAAAPAAPAPTPAPAPAPAAPAPAAPATPAPATPAPAASGTVVTSPLPGNVLSINVNVGDAVKAGQLLVLIEAMKMENEIVAPTDGVVKQIVASKGAVVATGDTLLVI